jgi:hypothetical protein
MTSTEFGKPASPAGRYMRYACGEIVLVVIGILIALQINNWNEKRKETISKRQLVKNLLLELNASRSSLPAVMKEADSLVTAGNLFPKVVGENDITVPVDSMKSKAIKSCDEILFKLNLSAYDESKSSGRLSLLDYRDISNG